MPEHDSGSLLTVAETATRLRLSERTILRWLANGRLRGSFLGKRAGWRIDDSEVDRIIREGQHPPPPD